MEAEYVGENNLEVELNNPNIEGVIDVRADEFRIVLLVSGVLRVYSFDN